MDRAGVAHLCCPLPLQMNVGPPNHLGSQQEALLPGQLHICHHPLMRVLQVALEGVEDNWRLPVELLLEVNDDCINGWLHV